jgi:hypothetical protein
MRGDERDDLGDEIEVTVKVMRAGRVYGSGVTLRVFNLSSTSCPDRG